LKGTYDKQDTGTGFTISNQGHHGVKGGSKKSVRANTPLLAVCCN